MALTFPGSPAVDDQTTTGGRIYKWTGYAWDLVGSGIAGPTGPAGSGTPVVIAVGTGSGDQPTNLALGGNVYDITFNGTGVVANPTGTHTDGQQILWRITRSAAEVVTLGTEFTIVSGSISNTTNYRTFVRATYSAAETKWFAEVTNVEVIPPAFTGVALLLHMDGANASTVFTDSSSQGLIVVPNGAAQISTDQSVFGGASAMFGGGSDHLVITGDWTWWSVSDYTIEFWLRANAVGGYLPLVYSDGGINVHLYNGGTIHVNDGQAASSIGNAQPIVADTWTHIAIVRLSGTITLYQDGVTIGTTTQTPNAGGSTFRVGGDGRGNGISGFIDEVRVTRGTAVYTGAFSPPASPLTDPV